MGTTTDVSSSLFPKEEKYNATTSFAFRIIRRQQCVQFLPTLTSSLPLVETYTNCYVTPLNQQAVQYVGEARGQQQETTLSIHTVESHISTVILSSVFALTSPLSGNTCTIVQFLFDSFRPILVY